MEEPNYLVKQPDGMWLDTRYRFGPGDKLRILEGPHRGRIATVTTLGAQMQVDGRSVAVACYNTELVADGRWVTVRWDAVELARDVDPDAITVVEEDEEFVQNLAREAEAVAEEDWPVEDRYSEDVPWESLQVEEPAEQTARSRSAGRRRRKG